MNASRAHDPDRIRRRRIAAGLNLPVLAIRAGISKSHLSNVERGRAGASPEVLARIAAALGCAITDLMPPEPVTSATAGVA